MKKSMAMILSYILLVMSLFLIGCGDTIKGGNTGNKGDTEYNKPSPVSDFEFKQNTNEKTYSVTKYIGSDEKVVIPLSYQNIPVTGVASGAFYECDGIKSLIISNSVTTIGYQAFACCSSLSNVTISDSVKSIGGFAFFGGSSLTNVTIPNGVTSMGEYLFSGCDRLASVSIGDSVMSIGSFAFCDCDSLTSITIPDSVTSIGSSAFFGCSSLTSITIPESVTRIESSAFSGCSALTSIDYVGCEDEWNAISKGSDWDADTGNYTINYNYAVE